MSFDEVHFPLRAGYGANGGPTFSTEIVTVQGGHERRNQNWSQARRRFDARPGVTSAAEAALLVAFFHARAGRARGFRLKDWQDYTSARDGVSAPHWQDQIIGTGDGAKTQFQLVKTYGDGAAAHTRAITKPASGSVRVGVDGTAYETGWSVDLTSGVITFAQAPAHGAVIRAGFAFDVPVRFESDRLNLATDRAGLAESKDGVMLIEVRD